MSIQKRVAEFLGGLANTLDPPEVSGELSFRVSCDASQAIAEIEKVREIAKETIALCISRRV
jgi:hypothetical protein